MPTPTYTALANVTLGSTASTVTFSSIPATYRDLVLVPKITNASVFSLFLRFNSDSGANYSFVGAYGAASPTSASYSISNTNQIEIQDTNSTSTPIINIMDYSATDKHKTILHRNGVVTQYVAMQAGRWQNTAAITTVQLIASGTTFSVGSSFALYGIAS